LGSCINRRNANRNSKEEIMLYVGYDNDMNENGIIFDKELDAVKSTGWKLGDKFLLIQLPSGSYAMKKIHEEVTDGTYN